MTAPATPRPTAATDINRLRRGSGYLARTHSGCATTGEYLGVEVIHDEWRILVRHATGTASIPLSEVASVRPIAP